MGNAHRQQIPIAKLTAKPTRSQVVSTTINSRVITMKQEIRANGPHAAPTSANQRQRLSFAIGPVGNTESSTSSTR